MKVLILYQPRSEHARGVEQFVRDLSAAYPDHPVELMDVDSVRGSELGELYDAVEYPTILALSDDGSVRNSWSGPTLPLINDVGGWMLSS